ncbi:MAG: methylenetetrahydrofolate reductase [Microthrixaceae bacterium]
MTDVADSRASAEGRDPAVRGRRIPARPDRSDPARRDARIDDLLRTGPTLSLEFFPPKTERGVANLLATVDRLEDLEPDFVSVTYGAGGSTRDRTRDLVVTANRQRPFPVMAHLTCVGHTRAELTELLEDYAASGVRNILALAGDPPADGSPAGGDFTFAVELVELIREVGDFAVAVAAHPETHPRSPDRASDRRHLADKLAVADFAITQFFFSASDYFEMVEELAELGVDTPIVPGVIPVTNPASVARFADMAQATRPPKLWRRLEAVADNPDALLDAAVDAAAELAEELLAGGAPGVHLYALNRAEAPLGVGARLGWRVRGRTDAP